AGLLVRFKDDVSPGEAAKALEAAGARSEGEVGESGYTLVSAQGRAAGEIRDALAGSEVVAAAAPNHVRQAFASPNDPYYPPNPASDYSGQAPYISAVGLPEAWDVTTGADDLTLAILDSGVDRNHPDLDDRLLPGYDFVNNDRDPSDDHPEGHGTMVTGVAGAESNNRQGVTGVAWRGRILPVKVIDHHGEANDADISAAIYWATDQGADVINLSLGGPGDNAVLQKAIDYAVARDVVVVAAAGNAHNSVPNYPAASRGVVAVGSTALNGSLADFSNFGGWIDVTAPGEAIASTSSSFGGYALQWGTSFSAPIVSGIAMLIRAADPGASATDVAARLRQSARDLGAPGFDTFFGAGQVDAAAALSLGPRFSTSGDAPGYWMLAADGSVYDFGDADFHGQVLRSLGPGRSAADVESTPGGAGYWLVDDHGAVFAYGDAVYHGGVTAAELRSGETVTSLSATPDGGGYWIFTTQGRVFHKGNAVHYGDRDGLPLNAPVLDSVPTPDGGGYYMVAADGGIFTYGNARFAGSMGGEHLNSPVRSLVPDPDGGGYWLVAGDGGAFSFHAPFRGSMGGTALNAPVSGMVAFGNGYLMVAEDGGIFNFSDLPFAGSLGDNPPPVPVIAVAAANR
ncbi:MAG: S8 family serine peptidase, partial [Acidimicrobiia bacterium]